MSLKNLAGAVAVKKLVSEGWYPTGEPGYLTRNGKEIFVPGLSKHLKNTPMGKAAHTRVNKRKRPNVSGVVREYKKRQIRKTLYPNVFKVHILKYGANYSNMFHLTRPQYNKFVNALRKEGNNITVNRAMNIARNIRFPRKKNLTNNKR